MIGNCKVWLISLVQLSSLGYRQVEMYYGRKETILGKCSLQNDESLQPTDNQLDMETHPGRLKSITK